MNHAAAHAGGIGEHGCANACYRVAALFRSDRAAQRPIRVGCRSSPSGRRLVLARCTARGYSPASRQRPRRRLPDRRQSRQHAPDGRYPASVTRYPFFSPLSASGDMAASAAFPAPALHGMLVLAPADSTRLARCRRGVDYGHGDHRMRVRFDSRSNHRCDRGKLEPDRVDKPRTAGLLAAGSVDCLEQGLGDPEVYHRGPQNTSTKQLARKPRLL